MKNVKESIISIDDFTVYCHNREEAQELKHEIFTGHIYYFETDSPAPFIIDAGAHIGLATLYFKKQYPAAKVIAIEPNPTSFALLQKNISENRLENVTLINAALSTKPGLVVPFFSDKEDIWLSTSSFLPGAWNSEQKSTQSTVETVSLAQFLTQPVDFLKLDIEGAELHVLQSARNELRQIKHIVCEFHTHPGQKLDRFTKLLEDTGFDVSVTKKGKDVDENKVTGLVMVEAIQE